MTKSIEKTTNNTDMQKLLRRCLVVALAYSSSLTADSGATVFSACPECGQLDFRGHDENCELWKLIQDLEKIVTL